MRFGLIGLGGIGMVRATALLRSPDVSLVAATDLDIGRLESMPASVERSASVEVLLARPEVEAVVIATPPSSHETLALAALRAGKHVLVEKPMAPTAAACRRMLAEAQAVGKILACGFNHRYFPAVEFVREALHGGRLGTLSHVRAYAGHVGLAEFSAPWMHDASVIGGGTLADNGVHLIDLVAHLLGNVDEVMGVVSDEVWKLGASEDNGIAILRRQDGVPATLHSSWTEWKGYRFVLEAYGDRGLARAYYAPMKATMITMDRPGGRRRVEHRFYPTIMIREKLQSWRSTVVRTFLQEFREFVALCNGRRTDLVIATGEDGWRAVAIGEAIRRSSREHAVVKLGDKISVAT